MLTPPLILQRKHRRKNVQLRKIGFGCALAVSLLVLGLTGSLVFGYMNLVRDLPSLDSLPVWLYPQSGRLFQPTRLYDRTGTHLILSLQNPAAKESQYLTLDPAQPAHLPQKMVDATLAAMDKEYWEHSGYTLEDIGNPDAHPTLVQQFVFDIYLARESPSLKRSIRERLLASQAAGKYGKGQILEWYLNSARYGPWIFGVDAAARVYFAKPAAQLTAAEAAFLASLPGFPQADPWDYPQMVLERQKEILQEMQLLGLITIEEAEAAPEPILELALQIPLYDLAPEFSKYVLAQLQAEFPTQDFERGGWNITTTLDIELQQQVQCTLQEMWRRVGALDNAVKETSEIPCQASQLLPSLPTKKSGPVESLSAAVLILDPKNGQILVMDGDVFTPRTAGTLMDPVVYLAAFSRGTSPASLIWDIPDPQIGTGFSGLPMDQYHGPVRARTALVNSYPQPVRTLYQQLGSSVIQLTANQLGLRVGTDPDSASSDFPFLESSLVSLFDMTRAYALFTNQGISAGQRYLNETGSDTDRLSPSSVIRLEDLNQAVWLDWSIPETRPVITSQLAYLMNHILSDETTRWPSLGHPNPLEIGRPAGARIGITVNDQGYWTIGYTPEIITGVWLGKPEDIEGEFPPNLSAGLWHAIMQYANQDQPIQSWEIPPGISFVDVCDPSGFLPTAYCPTIVTEVFLNGTEPAQPDYLFRPYQVNRETGRLATVFTPPELVEDKIFMVVPVEAAGWASVADLPTPPDAYDVIYTPPFIDNIQITTPEMFAHVRGEVQFRGTAGGPNFEYYRLQIGQGLNPQVWTQVDEDSYQPVSLDLLGTWDTTGLSGLYAVQLLVVGKDQRVERAVMQVTVDNVPPTIQILNPVIEQVIQRVNEPHLVLNAQVQDNLEIGRVEFLIDGEPVSTLISPPFFISWEADPGLHTLLVKAYDLAGNASESTVRFRVK